MIKKTIERIVKSGRVAFVGVGNIMRADDGVGPYIVSKIRDEGRVRSEAEPPRRGWKRDDGRLYFIDAGQMPENYIGRIAKFKPHTVVIIDALDFKSEPGQIKVAAADRVNNAVFSTHGMPLNLFTEQIRQLTGADVLLFGIQPKSTALCEGLTEAVKSQADKMAGYLTMAIGKGAGVRC